MTASPHITTLRFRLTGQGGPYDVALVLLVGSGDADMLCDAERAASAAFLSARRAGFIAGRTAAKRAVMALRPDLAATSLCIANGALEQPVLSGAPGLSVSISHAEELAIAIAFPDACPMGVDLEIWPGTDVATLRSQMTPSELHIAAGRKEPEELALMRLWCLKEALSKALRTGLTLPMHLMELSRLEAEGGQFLARYKSFGQYRGLAVQGERAVAALAVPRLLQGETDLSGLAPLL